jgi:hypothetical protein
MPDPAGPLLLWTLKIGLFLALPALTFAQGQEPRVQDQIAIQEPTQLVNKKINVGRLPLCEPGTYKVDLGHAGMEATVLSANPSNTPALPKSVLDKMSPNMRGMMLDQQKAALLLLQFGDGTKRDTCAAIGPKKLGEYIELSPGQTLDQVTPYLNSANLAAPKATPQQIGEFSHEEVAESRAEQINMSGGGTKHAAKMFVPGLTPQFVWTFRDARAPVQVADEKPTFCVKSVELPPGVPSPYSPRDLVIAKFDEKKDHRELQTTSGASMFTFKSGLSKERVVETSIVEITPSLHLITVHGFLAPGEYLLAGNSIAVSGFDFGFHPKKK